MTGPRIEIDVNEGATIQHLDCSLISTDKDGLHLTDGKGQRYIYPWESFTSWTIVGRFIIKTA